MQRSRSRREPGRAQGKFSLSQGVQYGQLFLAGPGPEALPELALALQNFSEVEGSWRARCSFGDEARPWAA